MVLQRAPASAKLWGQAIPGTSVRISFSGISLSTVAGADSVWIQTLPPQPSSSQGVSILLNASTGESKVLEDVLFGDVYVCGGQSNMAYEMAGFINSTAILEYPNIRLLSVGGAFSTQTPQIDYPHVSLPWTSAANSSGFPSIIGFSMVCFFFGKGLTDGLGADAPPIGLISSNVGGTRIGFWASQEALAPCSCTQCEQPSSGYYNGMIYPLKNMAITGVLWYQGENDVIESPASASNSTYTNNYYQCAERALINDWRTLLNLSSDSFFGIVQLSSFCLKSLDGNLRLARMREQQLEGLSFPGDAFVTQADYGWGCDYHPPWKTHCALRLANASLAITYGKTLNWRSPSYRSAAPLNSTALLVTLSDTGSGSLTLLPSAPNNQYVNCSEENAQAGLTCAWGALQFDDPARTWVNATVGLSSDGQALLLQAPSPQGSSKIVASSYGYGAIPMMVVYRSDSDLPVLPWNKTL